MTIVILTLRLAACGRSTALRILQYTTQGIEFLTESGAGTFRMEWLRSPIQCDSQYAPI